MAGSIEDMGANCLAKLFVIGLVFSAISWVIQWICRKVSENASSIAAVLVVAVLVSVVVVVTKNAIRISKESKAFLHEVEPPMKSLESEAARQRKQLDESEWSSRLARMEKTLANCGA